MEAWRVVPSYKGRSALACTETGGLATQYHGNCLHEHSPLLSVRSYWANAKFFCVRVSRPAQVCYLAQVLHSPVMAFEFWLLLMQIAESGTLCQPPLVKEGSVRAYLELVLAYIVPLVAFALFVVESCCELVFMRMGERAGMRGFCGQVRECVSLASLRSSLQLSDYVFLSTSIFHEVNTNLYFQQAAAVFVPHLTARIWLPGKRTQVSRAHLVLSGCFPPPLTLRSFYGN